MPMRYLCSAANETCIGLQDLNQAFIGMLEPPTLHIKSSQFLLLVNLTVRVNFHWKTIELTHKRKI